MQRSIQRIAPRMLLGIGLVLLGLVFTLDNLGLVNADEVLEYWPVLVIGVGLLKLMSHGPTAGALCWARGGDSPARRQPRLRRQPVLAGRLDADRGVDHHSWPVQPSAPGSPHERGNEFVSAVAFMSGVKKSSNAQTFRGGDLTAVMGGVEIDLRQASMEPGSDVTLDTLAFWGGIEIRVPEDWEVRTPGFAIMGGFVDESRPPSEPTGKRLLVGGMALMGAVEIKN